MPDLSPEAKASWRRWWRNGPLTPRQLRDEAVARIAAAEESAESQAELRTLADPYDYAIVERATDPLSVHIDKARRVHRGQATRRIKRRLNASKHRQNH
jgi:hypothetical protein